MKRRRALQWTGKQLHGSFFQSNNKLIPHAKSHGKLAEDFVHGRFFQRRCVRWYDQNFRTEFLRQKSQQNTVPPLVPFAAQPYAEGARKWYGAASKGGGGRGEGASSAGFVRGVFRRLVKLVGGVLAISGVAVVGAPYVVSSPSGLSAVVYLINWSIPGTLSVDSVSLGWREPVRVEGVSLKGPDSNLVLSIREYQTSAHLWTMVAGRSGLGDAVVVQPTLDWRRDPKTGHLYFDLALTSVDKLNVINPYAKKNFKVYPSEVVSWNAKVQAPRGELQVASGKVTLPGDVAAVLGSHLFFDIAFGSSATGANASVWKGNEGRSEHTPIRCSMKSDRAHLKALAYLNFRKKQMVLLQPITAEMDLSPALAKFYLAQINPILGQIVGPSIGREDLPDVTMHVTPAEMVWPANEFFIRIEPMKVVLAKGPLLHDLLSLLRRGDLEDGNRQITMQTSAVEANVHMGGSLKCFRVDLLIADKIHVATWGLMDHVHETMKMTLAVPGTSLRDLLGLTRISPDYHLQIPINGSFDRPQVDWAAAGRGITQLALQRNVGGNLLSAILEQFDIPDADTEVPKPIGDLPWARG
ncbi:hypothetical protein KC19_9G051300 [Ceratodon purpureus]|uniref:Uncharacterized protein n=1 Tax=Ceratodon purpureus TaxID=3225 RepID=A0A8T0GQJ5_CERPU|nr:hypothetical protein KC19_9G051300 [Ceratodon purpureus]